MGGGVGYRDECLINRIIVTFEVFTAVKIECVVFYGLLCHWIINVSEDCAASSIFFNPEDGCNTVLQNVGIQPPHYMVQ